MVSSPSSKSEFELQEAMQRGFSSIEAAGAATQGEQVELVPADSVSVMELPVIGAPVSCKRPMSLARSFCATA
jgi:hypothetical protein